MPFQRSFQSIFLEQSIRTAIASGDIGPAHHDGLICQVLEMFGAKFSRAQVIAALELTNYNGIEVTEFLTLGPQLKMILHLLSQRSQGSPSKIAKINEHKQCSDLISFYKNSVIDWSNCKLVIHLENVPAIDAGGVRRQIYTTVLKQLSDNNYSIRLFEGKKFYLRPYYTASAMDTEIFRVLGCIIGHSIIQEGIGFPYLSPLCYWYIVADKNKAMQHYTDDDVGDGCNEFIERVSTIACFKKFYGLHSFNINNFIDFML